MAKNNKRVPVKWIRDKAKAAYEKTTECYICGTEEDLELHHLYSISDLLEKWCNKKGYTLETDEDIINVRDEFIAEHHDNLYKDVYTLCNTHHVRLHSIYGKSPRPETAQRQAAWIQAQKDKVLGRHIEVKSAFGKFLTKEL